MNSVVCTLYEHHYELGVGALINSLCNQGFKGKIAVGHRGDLPGWLSQIKDDRYDYFLNQTIELNFYPIKTSYHLAYYKPFFMLELFEKFPNCDQVFYFDPDICNKCSWSFYENWVSFGLAACLDNCYGGLPSQHPWRYEWLELGKKLNYEQKQTSNFYLNSGFVGVKRLDISSLQIWKELTIALEKSGYDITRMKKIGREHSIVGDQDIFNAAIMFSDVVVSPVGPDGMDFSSGGFLMSHATSSVKPWKKRFIYDVLVTGNIPSIAEAEFFNHLMYPINLYDPVTRLIKKLDLKLAKALGRIVGH